MCLNAFPLISGHSSIRHPPLHAHKGVRLQGARASCASSVLPGSRGDLSLIRRASPLQHIPSNIDPHLAFIVTYFTSTYQKYTCKATQIYLILCEASSGSFSQRVSAHDCCSNQHAHFWKKTPPKIFQNLSWVSLFFIFDLKNVNISHDIFDIL